MASVRRERLFENYRNRKNNAFSRLNKGLWSLLIPFGGLWLGLMVYYFIKGLALLAGASMVMGQIYANQITGRDDPIPLLYKTPYLLIFYLFCITVLALISRLFKKKKLNTVLSFIFIGAFIFGIVSIYRESMQLSNSVILMASSLYGFWCCDYILRQHKELDFLSKQEGYPDFVDLVGEPVPIANTRGIYMRQYELLKESSRNKTKDKLSANDSDSCVDINDYLTTSQNGSIAPDAMDELTTNFNEPIEDLLKKAK